MPNRIIKESIWTSPNLNNLSALAERHFYRILPLPDDHGCCELTPEVVLGRCYPKQLKIITETDIDKWQQELEENNLIIRWDLNGRQYGIFVTFSTHQRIRSLHDRKTPAPPPEIQEKCGTIEAVKEDDASRCQLPADDSTFPQAKADTEEGKDTLPYPDSDKIWESALKELKGEVNKSNFRTWLENTRGLDFKDGIFVIGTSTSFVSEYLEQNQRTLIKKTLVALLPSIKAVKFKVVKKDNEK